MSKRTASAAGLGSDTARSSDVNELPRGVSTTRGPTGLSLFRASIVQAGTTYELGSFASLNEAAHAYDAGARRIHGPRARLNFPAAGEHGVGGTSSLTGCSWNPKASRWEVRLKYQGAMLYIGCFDEENDAALAWDVAALRLRGPLTKVNFEHLRQSSLVAARAQTAAGGQVGNVRSMSTDQKRARTYSTAGPSYSFVAASAAPTVTFAPPPAPPRKALPTGTGARALLLRAPTDDSPLYSQHPVASASVQPLFCVTAPDSTQQAKFSTLRFAGFDFLAAAPRAATIAADVSMTDSGAYDDVAMASAALSLCSLYDSR